MLLIHRKILFQTTDEKLVRLFQLNMAGSIVWEWTYFRSYYCSFFFPLFYSNINS